MSYPITPSVYRNDNILAVSTPTYCEEVSGNWRYVFGIMPKAGYRVEIDSVLYVHNATTTEATIQDKGKSISGYYTYWADMPVAGDNQPDGITIFASTPAVVKENYSLSALKGTGIRSVTFYRILDGTYIESDYAKVGEDVLFRIALESSASSMITPYVSYTDAGGTVHQVSLSHQPNSNEYIFTMPSGDVVVATNAESSGGGGGSDWEFVDKDTVVYPVQIVELAPLEAVYEKARETFILYNNYTRNFPTFESLKNMLAGDNLTRLNEIDNLSTSKMVGVSIKPGINGPAFEIFVYKDMSDTVPFTAYSSSVSALYYINGIQVYLNTSGDVRNVYIDNNGEASIYAFSDRYWVGYGYYNVAFYGYGCTNLLTTPHTPSSILVDYTLTPDTAGEIDGPDTLESSANFFFTFTLNPGYQFQRADASSVIRGENNINTYISAQTSVTVSGNIYTIAVSGLNENLNGVNIVLTCLNTRDPNSTPTTPTTTNTPQGGDGDHDPTSDVVTPSAVPSLSAHDSGLITVFRPTLAQLQALGSYLWTNITDFIENLQKWFSNPMDFIISLTVVPCIPDVGTSRNVQIGLWETSISMPPVTSQWVTIDCGTIQVTNFYGSALDYSPYTKISAMLPFVGSVSLDTDELMGKNIQLIYRIDIVSGHCVAMIVVDRSVLYQFSGECSATIPLTGADWSRVYGALVNTGIGIATIGTATAGIAAAEKTAEAFSEARKIDSVSKAAHGLGSLSMGMKGIKGVTEAREIAMQNLRNAANLEISSAAGGKSRAIGSMVRMRAIANTVGAVMGAKVQTGHASSITGNAGLIGTRKPYLLIEYPNQSLAEDYKHYMGYPCNVSGTIGSFSGYTEFQQVIPNINCLDDELEEILDALKGGVYL